MANHSLSHKLVFSQEQMQSFVAFKEAGSEFFYKYSNSIAQHERWGNACVSITFILVAACQSSAAYNFELTAEHANSLHEMLNLVDDLQNHYFRQVPNLNDVAESLLKKMFSTLKIFRSAIENMIEKK